MPESPQHLFDLAQERVPPLLRPNVENHWREFRDHLPELPHAGVQKWLPSLPRVFAASDFVARTCIQHPGVLRELISRDDLYHPRREGDIAHRVAHDVADAPDEATLKARLRAARRREMLRIAFRDLAGWADLGEVIAATSELADACLDVATARLYEWAVARHGAPTGEASGAPVALVVLGMGKLGGRELNFSSDIDLVFAYAEEGETTGASQLSNHEFFVRLCQRLISVIGDATADGIVFRVDMRLRPHGTSGPLALSFDAMEQYYQTHGREWERYAFIKARAVAGDRDAGAELLRRLKPFVYRKYLDYGAFEAIRSMKTMIDREVSRKGLQGNIKLGWGGIREVEFLVQTLQMIRGGREPALQEPNLLTVLPRLAARGYVDPDALEALTTAYVFLRNVEHRLQMVNDSQTQTLPRDPLERERVAFACGHADWAAFDGALSQQRRAVQAQFAQMFSIEREPAAEGAGEQLLGVWLGIEEAEGAQRALREAGYRDPERVLELLTALREGSAYVAFSAEGRSRMDRLVPLLLVAAGATADPDTTLARLIHLLEAIGRRSAYLALLVENAQVLEQLVKLSAASPWVANWIAQHPILLDELLDPRSLYALPTRAMIGEELRERLAHVAEDDLELQMEIMREVRHGNVLRVAAADLGPGLAPEQAGAALAQVAEAVLEQSLVLATRTLVAKHGEPRCQPGDGHPGFAVIGYGKLGSLELGYASDLDMIFIYEACAEHQEALTDGPRSLSNEHFFARLGQRLIHFLTTRTPGGVLYEVDMRLRPSGKAGPLVTSLPAFRDYQCTHAWTWEHQALVRARAIAGKPELCRAFAEVRKEILCLARDPGKLQSEVREMRGKMLESHAGRDPQLFDIKHDPGGIVDIEFMVQYCVLRWAHEHPVLTQHTDNINILKALLAEDLLEAANVEVMTEAYRRYLSMEHRLKLMERGSAVPVGELGDFPGRVRRIWDEVLG